MQKHNTYTGFSRLDTCFPIAIKNLIISIISVKDNFKYATEQITHCAKGHAICTQY